MWTRLAGFWPLEGGYLKIRQEKDFRVQNRNKILKDTEM